MARIASNAGGLLINISEGGASVHSLVVLANGEQVPMLIDMPHKPEPLRLSGIVAWSDGHGAAGIRFTDIGEKQRGELCGFLHELEARSRLRAVSEQDECTRIISVLTAQKLKIDAALDLIVRRAIEVAHANGAAVALGPADHMVCRATSGMAPNLGVEIRPNSGLTGECIRTRKLVYCLNTEEDSRVDPAVCRELNLGSAVVLPLIAGEELVGVLEAFAAHPDAFGTEVISTLEKLADAVLFVSHGIRPTTLPEAATNESSENRAGAAPEHFAIRPNLIHSAVPLAQQREPSAIPVVPSPSSPAPDESATKVAKQTDSGYTEGLQSRNSSNRRVKGRATDLAQAPSLTRGAPATAAAPALRPSQAGTYNVTELSPEVVSSKALSPTIVKRIGITAAALVLITSPFVLRNYFHSAPTTTPPTKVSSSATPAPSSGVATSASIPAASNVGPVASPNPKSTGYKGITPSSEKRATVATQPEPIILAQPTSTTHETVPETPAPVAQLPVPRPEIAKIPMLDESAIPKLSPAAVSKGITGGRLLKHVNPDYPKLGTPNRLSGDVVLNIHVAKDGSVNNVRRVSGNLLLSGSAIRAVKQWRYEPFRLNDKPIDIDTTVILKFKPPG